MMLQDIDKSEFNLFSLYDEFGNSKGISEVHKGHIYNSIRTVGSSWPNAIYNLKASSLTEENFNTILSDINDFKLAPLLVLNEKVSNSTFLRSHFFLPIDRWIKMSLNVITRDVEEKNGALQVRKIEDSIEINNFVNLVSVELFKGKELSSNVFEFLVTKTKTLLLGLFQDDTLIGTSMIYIDPNGVAGFYMVCVKKDHQGKGFGKYLMNESLKFVKQQGVAQCTLQSTAAGCNLYSSMGFLTEGELYLYWKIK